ncbi:inositol monophosphatase family protein [Candidatus Synechococcus calcipolaris G9]|uniref:Inositol monophosphatase family protein n=1 Tax=Candidatus Synechococcus calcipolaris G9 TaxID=1497997 RepID=A0ABT6F2W3_9SYNE|nr:inositol monophosphatase family protein [Candidatus Synechococcus calcipolaris]MDG2992183.1 inositol monophosphatase family protein [Candidatus Synechococcus calcipolaris G9]
MTSPDLDSILSSAQVLQINQLMRQAGQRARELAQQPFDVIEKGRQDFATSIDRLLDRQLSQKFRDWFPSDGIISEENADSTAAFSLSHQRFWLIDPLDGTDDLIHHKEGYSVMVGLLQDHVPIAGWIYNPAKDHLFYGGKDWGLFQVMAATPTVPLVPQRPAPPSADFCPIMIGQKDFDTYGSVFSQLLPEAQFYFLGSFGLKVIEVILGRAGLYIYLNQRVKLWDTTAPLALAKAAGLVCCDLEGHPLEFDQAALLAPSLTHRQPIIVGWPDYIQSLQPRLVEAIAQVKLDI